MPIEANTVLSNEQIQPLEIAADKWIKGLKRSSRINKELINAIPALCATVKTLRAENAERDARIEELERRLRIPFGKFPCAQCGGPHDFDTSVPSVVWNSVIRARKLPDYLCTTCIVREFVRVGQGFTAKLWNEEFNGVPIEVVVNGQNAKDVSAIQQENNALRNRFSEVERERDDANRRASPAAPNYDCKGLEGCQLLEASVTEMFVHDRNCPAFNRPTGYVKSVPAVPDERDKALAQQIVMSGDSRYFDPTLIDKIAAAFAAIRKGEM